MSLVGWSDAALGGRSTEGKSRVGFVIGLKSSSFSGPFHILQWKSKFARKFIKRAPFGEVGALSEMVEPLAGGNPGSAGLEDCESPFTHL